APRRVAACAGNPSQALQIIDDGPPVTRLTAEREMLAHNCRCSDGVVLTPRGPPHGSQCGGKPERVTQLPGHSDGLLAESHPPTQVAAFAGHPPERVEVMEHEARSKLSRKW